MFFDSHFHLDSFAAKSEIPDILERAAAAGVDRMLAIGGSDAANALALDIARAHPGRLWATAGYDRDLAADWDGDLSRLRPLLGETEVRAVGECGLDYFHRDPAPADQRRLFADMLQMAAEFGKPVVVHSREAEADTLALLREFRETWPHPERPCAVLHCFTGDQAFAEALLEENVLISFSGILTFQNAQPLREVAKSLPLDSLLIETDSPYLAPMPYRGQRNEPARVVQVAECLARLREETPEVIAAATTRNALQWLNLSPGP